jgi:peptide/nickel transport system substrate-binding protein
VEFFETPWFQPGIFMASKVVFDRLLLADETMTPSKGNLASDTV